MSVRSPTYSIQPTRGWAHLDWREVWQYRDLLKFLIARDLRGKYRQMALGPMWVVLQPLMTMIVLSVIFGRVAKLDSGGTPYPLLTFAALIPWTFFSKACQGGVTSLVSEMGVISKVYFPRISVLLAAVLSRLVDFAACCAIFAVLMLAYGVPLRPEMLVLPIYVLLVVMTALAVSLWTASLTVRFHDVRFLVEYGMQILMFLSPVAYAGAVIEKSIPSWMWLYKLNPLYWIIEGFRWCLLGTGEAPAPYMLVSCGLVILMFVSGAFVFRRTERTIVDYL